MGRGTAFSVFPHSLPIPIFSTKISEEEQYSSYAYLYIPVTGTSRICLSWVASKGHSLIN